VIALDFARPSAERPLAPAEDLTILVLSRAAERFGGTPAHVFDSAIAMREAGATVELAVALHSPEVDSHEWIHHVPGLDAASLGSGSERAVRELIDRIQPDVVHVHDLYDGVSLRRLAGDRALVWSVHNFVGCISGYWSFPDGRICTRAKGPACFAHELIGNCGQRRARKLHLKDYSRTGKIMDGLRAADASVVYSGFVREHHVLNGLPEPHVLPLFVSTLAEPTPVPDDGPVLFAGRLILQKGVMLLLRAIEQLDCELVVAGSGWAQPAMERFVRKRGLSARVRFAGWQSMEALATLYRQCSAVVVPSTIPEGFALVGIEAFAANRPVVATNRGGMDEWLIPGVTGLVAALDPTDLASAIQLIIDDGELRARLAGNGQRLVSERFTAGRFVEEAFELYRSLTSDGALRSTAVTPVPEPA
jgi:glycosyltransferase involved in cell wall biosynthesis